MTVIAQAFFLIVTLLAAAQARAAEVDLVMVVRPAVRLDFLNAEHDLTLVEIVDLATVPISHRTEVERHLKSVILTDRPAIGEERAFSQEGLESVVAEATRRLEAAGYAVTWRLPRRSHIFRILEFNAMTVLKKLEDELRSKCNGCDLQLRGYDFPRELTKLDAKGLRSWTTMARSERPRGSFAVPLQLEFHNGKRQTVMLSGMVDYWRTLPVTTRSLNAGEKIRDSDFKLERRNVSYSYDEPPTLSEIEGSVAARGMQAGEPLMRGILRREQLVKFGDVVRVQVGGDTYSISAEGVAQTAAAIGETVQVRVGKNKKMISGILKEKGLVEIQ
ncbi:MAG: flagellar basal body P-ring formation protein FlgA [Deltaproteobacteria bacterium]|jgi:flagella basal body P-ring formation protein FlgA|nr:flagellar basal body P-ring formation protein FlgA [Deltaproteobacteria bacterium]